VATPALSLIIPTLNAARPLKALLTGIDVGEDVEIVVADGGSVDDTRSVAEHAGALVVSTPKGRGVQLQAGARAARSPGLFFLHADSTLPPDWRTTVAGFLVSPAAERGAAAFRLAFDAEGPGPRRVAAAANWRSRVLGLPYGDQGLVLRRSVYETVGGYRALPLMEDVDLVRRIGRRRLHLLDATLVTSAERYRRDGWIARPARNLTLLALFFLGMPPRWLARLYG